jgi:hypothetical protein
MAAVEMKEFTLIKQGEGEQQIKVPLTHNLAQVRKDYQIEDEWVFMLPGVDIQRSMEGMFPVSCIEGNEIILEAPNRKHIVNLNASKLRSKEY